MAKGNEVKVLKDPPYADVLFNSTKLAWAWALVRVWLGWQWLEAGIGKVQNPAWVANGQAVKGYWTRAVAVPEGGSPAITYDWYRSFLQTLLDNEYHVLFGKVIAWGEVLVGIGLILGLLTGFAALGGALMNFNFMLAGTASTNPVLFLVAVLIIMGWKTAGWIGVDRWLLPMLGTPWSPGPVAIFPTGDDTQVSEG